MRPEDVDKLIGYYKSKLSIGCLSGAREMYRLTVEILQEILHVAPDLDMSKLSNTEIEEGKENALRHMIETQRSTITRLEGDNEVMQAELRELKTYFKGV